MPTDRHLKLNEIIDFSGGLWEVNDWLMPANAFQEMTDCYPQSGGGIRAFFKSTAISASGIAEASIETPIGLFARGGIPLRSSGLGNGVDRYLMTFKKATGAYRPRLYRMDGSNNETTWTQIYHTSGTTEFNTETGDNNGQQKCTFRYFKTSAGVEYVLFTLAYNSTTPGGFGLWRVDYATVSSALKAIEISPPITGATRPNGPIAVHQARVFVEGGENILIWSDAGGITFSASNYLAVEPNQVLPNIVAIHPTPPSALLLIKEGAPMVNIHGDVADSPTVYQLAEGLAPGGTGKQDVGRTPYGVTYVMANGHIYLTTGESVEDLSPQLANFTGETDFVGTGDTNFIGEFLFAPKGYVMHWPTKAWFKQTQLAGLLHNVEAQTRTIWGTVGTGASPTFAEISPFPGNSRLNTYSFKTAPLRSDDGRQIEIREVELVARSYDASAQLAVTVGASTVTKTLGTVGRQKVSFLFNTRDEMLDIRVVSTAGNSANEAPSVEAVRFKSRPGHQTY